MNLCRKDCTLHSKTNIPTRQKVTRAGGQTVRAVPMGVDW